MPFKSLASLKKHANLGAEVVGLAPLHRDGLVGALTTDPVKVAMFKSAGGSPKVTNVTLDEVSGIALLNKAVAVVKCGDDLWALLDIQHKPKVEQIGRDIRSLSACPQGESALAVGWDGNGAELAFQNNEVGGRQFVVRGDVRAASVTDTHAYVVVDSASGGQLREHPGRTPESGASARADLPADAAGFDRLAGGQELSALTGKGSNTVCVVRRQGAALEAIMLPVAGGIVDVAVIGTSLFVLSADGKLRLFDGEAVARIGSDLVDETFELDLRPDGEPTTLLATSTGGNKLWVGTKGGDVISCNAVKGGLQI